MGIDNQGKNSDEKLNKGNQRPRENKPDPVTQQQNRTIDKVNKVLKK